MKRNLGLLLIIPIIFSCSPAKTVSKNGITHYAPCFTTTDGKVIFPLNTTVDMTSYIKYSENKQYEIFSLFDEEIKKVHTYSDAYHDYDNVIGIKKINENYGKEKLFVDPSLITLIDNAIKVSEYTKGKFNLTLGCLIDVWKEKFENGEIYQYPPSKSLVNENKDKVIPFDELRDYIILDKDNSSIEFRTYKDFEEIKINLGAISKGFSLQEAGKVLPSDSFILSAGSSSLKLIGEYPVSSRKNYLIDLTAPALKLGNQETKQILQIKCYKDENVSTSGDYQKFFVDKYNGTIYSHILNPETGYSSSLFSEISLVSKLDGDLLDGLSTALMNCDSIEEAINMINVVENNENGKIDYAFIKREGTKYSITVSSSYNERITIKNSSIINNFEIK